MSVGIRQKWGSADGKVAVMESAPSLLDRKHARVDRAARWRRPTRVARRSMSDTAPKEIPRPAESLMVALRERRRQSLQNMTDPDAGEPHRQVRR